MLAITRDIGISKANAAEVAGELRARVADGRMDLFGVFERLRFFEEVAGSFADDTVRARLHEEIAARGAGTGKVVTDSGVFSLRQTGTKYNYEEDRVWRDLVALGAMIAERKKQREDFLKVLPSTVEAQYQPPVNPFPSTDVQQLLGKPKRWWVPVPQEESITTKPITSTSTEGYAYAMNKA